MAVVTFTEACTGCGACLLTCPTHAIRPSRAIGPAHEIRPAGGQLAARPELCTGCGECIEICPADAIRLPAEGED